MSRIEIADPLIALPWLEKRIEIWRGEDQNSVRLKDAANFADRPRRVGQMLDDVFDDDHAESRICKRQILPRWLSEVEFASLRAWSGRPPNDLNPTRRFRSRPPTGRRDDPAPNQSPAGANRAVRSGAPAWQRIDSTTNTGCIWRMKRWHTCWLKNIFRRKTYRNRYSKM